MNPAMKQRLAVGVLVLVIVASVASLARRCGRAGPGPDERQMHMECADCGHAFDLRFGDMDPAAMVTDETGAPVVACPSCGQPAAREQETCPACGARFLADYTGNLLRCPECKVDIRAWYRENRPDPGRASP